MDRIKPRILCVGSDELLLECRSAVLERNGFEASSAVFPNAYDQLRTGNFDLVIISAQQAAEQNGVFSGSLPSQTQTLVLHGFTFPAELLAAVGQKLQVNSRDQAQAG